MKRAYLCTVNSHYSTSSLVYRDTIEVFGSASRAAYWVLRTMNKHGVNPWDVTNEACIARTLRSGASHTETTPGYAIRVTPITVQ